MKRGNYTVVFSAEAQVELPASKRLRYANGTHCGGFMPVCFRLSRCLATLSAYSLVERRKTNNYFFKSLSLIDARYWIERNEPEEWKRTLSHLLGILTSSVYMTLQSRTTRTNVWISRGGCATDAATSSSAEKSPRKSMADALYSRRSPSADSTPSTCP